MRRERASLALAILCLLGLTVAARADEDRDLDRIPDLAASQAEEPVRTHGRFFVEAVPAATTPRSGLAVPFPSATASWQTRLSLDARDDWRLADRVTAHVSDRFNLLAASDFAFLSRQSLRNDFREGYVTWEPAPERYVEAGRINLRNGVALGFNPTDFFKTRSAIGTASLDPSELRENRLGTAMVRGQALWNGAAASLAFAPRLDRPSALADIARSGFDPRFDRTNAADRLLATLALDVADLAPQALLYYESGVTRFGLNLSHGVGSRIVAYSEWAGGVQPNLITQGVRFGRATGTLPAAAPVPLPTDASRRFRNDVALGASWTGMAKITVNLEYHYHQAGFSRSDWRNWFARGTSQPLLDRSLWYLRGYAADQQQPLSQHELFLRADWSDAFVPNLEIVGLAFVDLYDGSSLMQLSASYFLSNRWTVGLYLAANLGPSQSERGSAPQAVVTTLRLVRYF